MKNVFLLTFLLHFIVGESQVLDWNYQALNDEQGILNNSTFLDTSGNTTVTLTWVTFTDGGAFKVSGGDDFVSYDNDILGGQQGYISLGFDNNKNDPDDGIILDMSFNPPVSGLTFTLLDVDEADDDDFSSNNHWDDAVEVRYNIVSNAQSFGSPASCVDFDNELLIQGFEGIEDENGCGDDGVDNNSTDANVNMNFGGILISRITIIYTNTNDVTNSTNPDPQEIGISGLSWNSGPTLLPVSLHDFNVESTQDGALLKWATGSEINNDRFEIERANEFLEFEYIGSVNGNGNSNQLIEYEFTDHSPETGQSYYRIKQFDYNGNFTYSDLIVFTSDEQSSRTCYQLVQSENKMQIKKYCSQDDNLLVEIRNLSGQIVYKERGKNPEVGLNELPAGMYIVWLYNSGRKIQTQKLTIY